MSSVVRSIIIAWHARAGMQDAPGRGRPSRVSSELRERARAPTPSLLRCAALRCW